MNTVDVKTMSDAQLIERVEYLVKRERQLVECLIWHLQEIQDRKLYIIMGYTSLFECLVKHFKYSESVAYGRISALKIIKDVPTVVEAMNKGELNLTTLTLAHTYFKKMDKQPDQPKITAEQKIQFIENLKNKSTQEVKQLLVEASPELNLPPDQVKYLNSAQAQLQAVIDKDLLRKIEYLKSLISHEEINPSFNELLHVALDAAIEKTEKKKGLYDKSGKTASTHCNSVRNSRYVPRGIKKLIFKRAQKRCEFIHKNGHRCNSTFQPQFDHIKAFSKGGLSHINNIQLLCRVHNAYKSNRPVAAMV